ncbi:ATP-dependent Lon protease [Clostridium acetobutylicum]|uniref:Lon protease n=1 Tax=Clostridium acetobutylicum (strain ATCC 824 / DSM 792 / JCM 1419 / IAM 19013 / LMG 5710 / NBRC 13948 / NRRL B-527 / VKM B-1787 / 2291 / W) TaxID=272562 RepID=LON_CLOAB|nr:MULTISPECIES: endopeptidase La [Clostridium]Q97FT9.1 RecName: Full=Lon protease; AltName: Full=ATP-dependent protease La [Clostridium acetobutylicum ATCC 824]AAK80584.1 ATP-dependent Lon protease [Clostridium acetobutylicum ATCC 824]ADZ21683.1 ATP-dependent Lon protease [Clostridium acetobutylicum EA 2018]AEI34517.1 ATP-dependent protease (lonA) [Clostridium acetobutylicum DSM 1731]AWV78999.1 Lon protease [Clostridium acetobutylicum]MBC2395041.1 endopeptidase La [Clostridium acetobutylicum
MNQENKVLPLIPLRGLIVFPYMVVHFDVGRDKSIEALEKAMMNDQQIFLSTQKDAKIEEPNEDDINSVGTICSIKQILRLPGDAVRVLVEGISRGKIDKYLKQEPFIEAEITEFKDEDNYEEYEIKALMRIITKEFGKYVKLSGAVTKDAVDFLKDIKEPGKFADIVSSYLIIKQEQKQSVLNSIDEKERLENVLTVIKDELQILELERNIGVKVKEKIDKSQREYYLREQIKVMQDQLGDDDEEKAEIKEYTQKIKKGKLTKEAKEKALHELKKLENAGAYSPEGAGIKTYLDWILSLPWKDKTKDNLDIKRAREILNKEHYGLSDVKDRIIEYLAVKKMSKSLKGPILCLVGPPGVGKTSIAKSIANAVNRNFVRISLGGVNDEAEIRGHRRTYVGAIPGRIIYGMKQAKSNNPLMLLDEIDKMSSSYKGESADALLEVLDTSENNKFRDNYLELDFDLSDVMFVTTANTLETIPRPLMDRMEIIEVSGYTYEEKFHIAKEHLIPKQLEEHNMPEDKKITFMDSSIYYIIENYTRESGVRSLERKIAAIIRKIITEIVEKDKSSISVNSRTVKKYLGEDVFSADKIDKEDKIGVVTGMAWTAYGGDTLPVEAVIMPGNGKLQLTGQLGDVMKESAQAGYSYVRANSVKYGIDKEFYKNKDIHVHVPEGAVPKDGPSAGVTMITAMVSALSDKKVKHNVAMTGEITLTGRVLAIGGLKEKTLAAYRAGVDTIIIPKQNEKDINKVPKAIRGKIKFILAEEVDTVLENALIGGINNDN